VQHLEVFLVQFHPRPGDHVQHFQQLRLGHLTGHFQLAGPVEVQADSNSLREYDRKKRRVSVSLDHAQTRAGGVDWTRVQEHSLGVCQVLPGMECRVKGIAQRITLTRIILL